jgi:DNA-binding XRE family transcriptional regulator
MGSKKKASKKAPGKTTAPTKVKPAKKEVPPTKGKKAKAAPAPEKKKLSAKTVINPFRAHRATESGELMKKLRKASGLTMRDVAMKMGFSTYQAIHNIENGLALPALGRIKDFAKLYKTDDKPIRVECVKYHTAKIRRRYGFKAS